MKPGTIITFIIALAFLSLAVSSWVFSTIPNISAAITSILSGISGLSAISASALIFIGIAYEFFIMNQNDVSKSNGVLK